MAPAVKPFREGDMASEKAIYWTAVAVLALAGANGFVNQYRGWAARAAEKSIAMAEQASGLAASYANPGSQDHIRGDLGRFVDSRVQMACLQSTLARHRAEMVRAQAQMMRVRAVRHEIHAAFEGLGSNFVVDVPEMPQASDDNSF
jgi:hypothetical protein